ncbi:MAG: polyprenyl synthetase family protein [Gammaproteobacteria bacterium]|nr:polyprenyl synthetase family protein [Gammaproteobacteria bacterium]
MMNHFNELLGRFIQTQTIPAARIREAIEYALFPGGKRLRPQLVYLTGEVLQLPEDILNPMALAIELMHTYSLVHDDLPAMDDDDFRRGRLSCHKAFDEATAILTGDALHALAFSSLIEGSPQTIAPSDVLNMIHILLRASGPAGMISGQSLDLSELSQKTPLPLARLNLIHHLKTAELIQACVQLPLQVCSPEKQQAMSAPLLAFAQSFGLAFQMQDDYLDAYHPDKLGKGHASDQANEKQTFATLYDKPTLNRQIHEAFQGALIHLNALGEGIQPLIGFLRGQQVAL